MAQAPSELNRLVCWSSEPAVTHTRIEVHVHVDATRTLGVRAAFPELPAVDCITPSIISRGIKMPGRALVYSTTDVCDGPAYYRRNFAKTHSSDIIPADMLY